VPHIRLRGKSVKLFYLLPCGAKNVKGKIRLLRGNVPGRDLNP